LPRPTPLDVFISHVEEDADLAVSLAGGLELAGFTTWYDERDTLPGLRVRLYGPA
jgi:hypothetical protein